MDYDELDNNEQYMVNEGAIAYPSLGMSGNSQTPVYKNLTLFTQAITGLPPIIKWPGGKEKELKYIIPNTPKFNRYFEPFVGGGSVFMTICADKYYINDLSSELIDLYRFIAASDNDFFHYSEAIDKSWDNALSFFKRHSSLIETY